MAPRTDPAVFRYRLGQKIGEGGMGIVYRATDKRLQREVAIKFISRGSLTEQHRASFLREARLTAALNHPNVCTIHEVGEVPDDDTLFLDGGVRLAAGTPFLAMEFIEGSTLHRKRTETGPLALEEVLDLAHQIAEALAEAHTHGIVHRDLKPGNVMVTGAGRVKILDFGLAKMLGPAVGGDGGQDPGDGATTSTQAGVLAGTPAYMSPEQVRGQAVDARSDVFSFGTMLYELLADRHPFPGESLPLVLAQVLEGQPEPLSRIRSDVPPELERIVRRCLEKRPERRYNDTRDLLNSVRDLRTGFWGSAGRRRRATGRARGITGRMSRQPVS